MILGIGNDIIEVKRIGKVIDHHGQRFLDRVFNAEEQEYCLAQKRSAEHLAGRWAAKEAISKALGTGIGSSLGWLDLCIHSTGSAPRITAPEHLLNGGTLFLSISHCRQYATAVAILEKK